MRIEAAQMDPVQFVDATSGPFRRIRCRVKRWRCEGMADVLRDLSCRWFLEFLLNCVWSITTGPHAPVFGRTCNGQLLCFHPGRLAQAKRGKDEKKPAQSRPCARCLEVLQLLI